MPKNVRDLCRQQFGHLQVVHFAGFSTGTQRKALWACRCLRCANPELKVIRGNDLKTGRTTSCGCAHRDSVRQVGLNNRRHGHRAGGKASLTYNSWQSMKARTKNPNNIGFRYYGARGITVAPEFETLEGFLAALGERPGPEWSIDRIDVNGPYSALNTKWSLPRDQARNRRKPVRRKQQENSCELPPKKPVTSVKAPSTSRRTGKR